MALVASHSTPTSNGILAQLLLLLELAKLSFALAQQHLLLLAGCHDLSLSPLSHRMLKLYLFKAVVGGL